MYSGFGFTSYSKSIFGNAFSITKPRFNHISKPIDGDVDVSVDTWLTYEVYYYDSKMPLTVEDGVAIQISEDGGNTYSNAFSNPYTTTIREKDGNTCWVKILRAGSFPKGVTVIIRHTAPDNFGNVVTKDIPVRWE